MKRTVDSRRESTSCFVCLNVMPTVTMKIKKYNALLWKRECVVPQCAYLYQKSHWADGELFSFKNYARCQSEQQMPRNAFNPL